MHLTLKKLIVIRPFTDQIAMLFGPLTLRFPCD